MLLQLRVLALIVGLLLLGGGQYAFQQDIVNLAVGLSLVSLPLILWGFVGLDPLPRQIELQGAPNGSLRRRRVVGFALTGLSFGTLLVFLLLEALGVVASRDAVLPYVACMVVFAAGLLVLGRAARPASSQEPSRIRLPRYEFIALVLILLLAATVRFWRLDLYPPGIWGDEAMFGLEARMVLAGEYDTPFRTDGWVGNGALMPYVVAGFAMIFGNTVESFRSIAALAGTAGVFFTYLLARRLFGVPTAVAAALLLAVSRWDITRSRTDSIVIIGVPFIVLAFYFLVRGLEERGTARLTRFAWSGFCTGLAFNFYHGSRIAPFLLIAVGIAFLVLSDWSHWRVRARIIGVGMLAALVGFIMTGGPLLRFLLQTPEALARLSYVWIGNFADRFMLIHGLEEPPSFIELLAYQTRAALLMFHYRGDCDPVFNLQCMPMLGPITGALFLLGLAWAFLYLHQTRYHLLVVWFVVVLVVGTILTDGAPNSTRVSSILPVIAILSGHALVLIWTRLTYWQAAELEAPVVALPAWPAALLIVGLLAGYINLEAYFDRFVQHPGTFRAYGHGQVMMGRELAKLPAATHSTRYLWRHDAHRETPVLRYLAPAVQERAEEYFHAGDWFLPPERGGTFYVFTEETPAAALQAYYPMGELRGHYNPWGEPLFWTFQVSSEMNEAARGLRAQYWPGTEASGEPTVVQNSDRAGVAPLQWPVSPPFVADWQGALYVPESGPYRLAVESNSRVDLKVNDLLLLGLSGWGRAETTVELVAGLHPIRVTMEAPPDEDPHLLVFWAPPGEELQPLPARAIFSFDDVIGLRARYRSLSSPAETREHIDPGLNYIWNRSMDPVAGDFIARWEGWLRVPRIGDYAFRVESGGSFSLEVDDVTVLDAGAAEGSIVLPAGYVPLRATYEQGEGNRYVRVYWKAPGREDWQLLPPHLLRPYP